MELSPLELYETAYKLHYIDKNISGAAHAYEKLIKEFPESNECGYAVIQLQRLQSADLSEEINRAGKSQNTLPVIAFTFSLLAILACGATVWYFKKLLGEERHRTTLTTVAVGKMLRGDDDDALRILSALKEIDNGNIAPYEFSADIYRKNDDLKKAAGEYEQFFRLNPQRVPTDAEKAIMKGDSSGKKRNQKKISLPVDEKSTTSEVSSESMKGSDKIPEPVQKEKPQAFDGMKKTNTERQISPVRTGEQPKLPVKGLFIVDPDSLSYF